MLRDYRLCTVFGIPIYVHGTLLLFLVLAGFLFSLGSGLAGFLLTLSFLAATFGFVLLHELGHSVAALLHGIPVQRITLYPLGGIAGLAHMPRQPRVELVVALAGPAVNFLLAGAFGIIHALFPSALWFSLLAVNLALGLFNLIPGFPLDGGRVLRALLARRYSYLEATRIATNVGRKVAVGLGVLGVLGLLGLAPTSPMLLPIAVFLYTAANAELRALQAEEDFARAGDTFPWPFSRGDGFWSPRERGGGGPREDREFVSPFSFDNLARRSRGRRADEVIEVLPDGTVRRVH